MRPVGLRYRVFDFAVVSSERDAGHRLSIAFAIWVPIKTAKQTPSHRQTLDHFYRQKEYGKNQSQEVIMDSKKPEYLDPETLSLVRATLDDAWDCLRPDQKSTMLKTDLAERILNAAGEGERDRERLLNVALTGLVS